MNGPELTFGCVSNLYHRQMHFLKAGDTEQGHKHKFDHLTLLAAGSLKVIVEGEETIFKAPQMILITKEKIHQLVAMEDNTIAHCIHVLRHDDGINDILEPNMVPKGIHPHKLIDLGIAKPLTWPKDEDMIIRP